MDWKLSIAGLLIGTLVGITGMGGGSLLTPMLVLLFGFKPTVAIGTDVLHGAIFKTFGGLRHRHLGTVHARLSGWMLIGSAPLSLVGVAAATWVKHRYGDGVESVMGEILGGALVFGGVGMIAKCFLRVREPEDPYHLVRRDRIAALLIGAFGGFIVGLTSVGSGTFFALTMLIMFPLHARKIVGTDIFHAAALLWVAGAGHLAAGNVDVIAMSSLLIGSIPGVLIGSQVSVRLPDRMLRIALGGVLVVSGIKLLDLPGSDYLVIALLTGGLLALGVFAARVLGLSRRAAAP